MRPSLYDFCTGHEQTHLLAQWDGERNAPLTPKDVTYGSHQKVWWRCPQGHSYRSEVRIRARGTGCPICAGRIVLPEENSLAAKFPDLLSDWDTEKNSPLLPTQVMPGAHRKVWCRQPQKGLVAVSCGALLRFGRQEPRAGHGPPRLRGARCSAGRKLPRGKVSRACRRMGHGKERLPAPDAGRRGNAEKSLVEMPQRAQLFRLCRVPCARLRLSGLWRKDGRPRRKRPRHPIPAACRPMGRCEKRRSDAGDGASWLQPPRVVALRRWTFLPRRHLPPRAERKRLSVLRQPQGPARLQRPRGHRAGRCLAVAPNT